MKQASLLVLAVALCSCTSESPPPAAESKANDAGHFREIADVKQVMNWIMDPASDVVWGSVGTIITEQGEQNLRPETDEQWTAVRDAAAMIAESGNLLLTPGRLRDEGDWVKHSHAMTKAAQEALAAAEAKDVDSLFTAGGDIYLVCTACHEQYAVGLKKVD